MLFSEVVGQNTVKNKLIQSADKNRIAHAQLFLGPEGSGNLALALAYAQYLNCVNKTMSDSCGKCVSCIKYNKLIHPDLHFSYPIIAIDKNTVSTDYIKEWRTAIAENPYLNYNQWLTYLEAENKQGNIPIAECHDIIKKLTFKSFEAAYKVLIMWLPEYLKETGNVLLKIIEEPPPDTIFLLVAENYDDLIGTITSRMQLMKINRISDQDLNNILISKNELSQDEASQLVFLSEGNYNKVLQLLAENKNNNDEIFQKWMRACFANKGKELILLIDEISALGREKQKILLEYSINLFRECILINSGASQMVRLFGKELTFIQNFSSYVNIFNSSKIIEEFNKAHYHIERNANSRILFLDLSVKTGKMLRSKTSILTST